MKDIFKNKLLRYIIAGGTSYMFELGFVLLFVHVFELSSVTSVAIAFWVGLALSFFMQKLFAFSSKTSRKKTVRQLFLYSALVAINYTFTLGFVSLFDSVLDVAISRTVALVITTIWNYFIYRFILFK